MVVGGQDVVLGFDEVEDYCLDTNPYFGATVGRVAGRIAVGPDKPVVDGRALPLGQNDMCGGNSLHGGAEGFHQQGWTPCPPIPLHDSGSLSGLGSSSGSGSGSGRNSRSSGRANNDTTVCLSHTSPDGHEGFPGEVTAKVMYSITDDGALRLDYEARTTRTTPIR